MASTEAWQKAATPFTLPTDLVSMFFPGFSPPTHSSAPVPTPAPEPEPEPVPDLDPIARRLDELAKRIKRLESGSEVPTNPAAEKTTEGVKRRLQQLEKRNGKSEAIRDRFRIGTMTYDG
jgi:hypothetical protein